LTRTGVTERETEVLFAVAERLRNREIADRLHISVRTVESHVAALLRKLGAVDRSELAEMGTSLRGRISPSSALATPLTSFIGREIEMGEVAALLDAHRLVTLVGPAGVGKTRLALGIATLRADSFSHGARHADLAPAGPELVGDTLARALGAVPQRGWPLRGALRELAGEVDCLLLVDNCEHVIGETADIIADLLAAGGPLKVLATSREPLGVPSEASYEVPALPVPTPHDSELAATAAGYDAVRLFADRAAIASPGFALTDAVAQAVSSLCRQLDGLPLAIELAASRVRSFGPAELVEHLDQRFELLSAGARTAAPRHRTLRGAIDWSYELLDGGEQALFDRLGVFPADFDFEAALTVCRADEESDGAVMRHLPRLVDKSLVSAVGSGTRRYRLLETIRSYAAERLAASGAGLTVQRRHAAHYVALAEQAAAGLRSPDQRTWLVRLSSEQPNLRAALTHTISVGNVESAWRLINALDLFWDHTGQRHEVQEWIQRLMAIGDPPATPVAVAGLAGASMIIQPLDSRAALDLAQRAARLATGLGDVSRGHAALAVGRNARWVQPELVLPALSEALARFGADHPWESALTMEGLAHTSGDLAQALAWGQESVALFRRLGDRMYAAHTLFIMAQRWIDAGIADDQVREWLTEGRALAEAIGSKSDQVHATVGFGQLAWLRGDHDGAAQLMRECLPTLRRLGDQRCTGRALLILGERARERGQLDRAADLLGRSVAAIALVGEPIVLVTALEAMAAICSAQSQPRQAAMLLGTARAARESASAHRRPVRLPDEKLRQSLVKVLGTAGFNAAHADGQSRSPSQALEITSPGWHEFRKGSLGHMPETSSDPLGRPS
jgi:predicted ATPase/DNA-binding CsgD family transcriptional regulator